MNINQSILLQYLDVDAAELLSLSVEEVECLLWSELDLDRPLGRLVQPLLHVHLVLVKVVGYSVVSMELISNEECDNFKDQVILKLTRHCEKYGRKRMLPWSKNPFLLVKRISQLYCCQGKQWKLSERFANPLLPILFSLCISASLNIGNLCFPASCRVLGCC